MKDFDWFLEKTRIKGKSELRIYQRRAQATRKVALGNGVYAMFQSKKGNMGFLGFAIHLAEIVAEYQNGDSTKPHKHLFLGRGNNIPTCVECHKPWSTDSSKPQTARAARGR